MQENDVFHVYCLALIRAELSTDSPGKDGGKKLTLSFYCESSDGWGTEIMLVDR